MREISTPIYAHTARSCTGRAGHCTASFAVQTCSLSKMRSPGSSRQRPRSSLQGGRRYVSVLVVLSSMLRQAASAFCRRLVGDAQTVGAARLLCWWCSHFRLSAPNTLQLADTIINFTFCRQFRASMAFHRWSFAFSALPEHAQFLAKSLESTWAPQIHV